MSMQDNQIDEIFRSKLGNLEIQPTERVWKGITVELDGAKPKRSLMPVFRIAAAVTVFLAAGLYFLLKDQPVDGTQNAVEVNGKHHAPAIILKDTEDQGQPSSAVAEGGAVTTQSPVIAAVPKTGVIAQRQKNSAAKTDEVTGLSEVTQSTTREPEGTANNNPVTTSDQPQLIAASGTTIKPVQTAVVPDQPLNEKPAEPEPNSFTSPVKNNTPVVADASATKPARKRHGIRSLGDLINVVVAKVDKRDDKVIEFSNTDDDESTITGINLGLVKVKKEK